MLREVTQRQLNRLPQRILSPIKTIKVTPKKVTPSPIKPTNRPKSDRRDQKKARTPTEKKPVTDTKNRKIEDFRSENEEQKAYDNYEVKYGLDMWETSDEDDNQLSDSDNDF